MNPSNFLHYCLSAATGVLILSSIFLSCTTTAALREGSAQPIENKWKELRLDQRYHVGLSIFDLRANKTIFGYRDDNYFTPGSNAKILTLYTALQILDDSLDAAAYTITGDTLRIWGGGDPGNAYPETDSAGSLVHFLQSTDKTILFSNDHFRADRYGPGWAWDDYPYSFQCERSAYPIYGNQVWITREGNNVDITPGYLAPVVSVVPDTLTRLERSEWGDRFVYRYDRRKPQESVHLPIALLKNDILMTWQEATGKRIRFVNTPVAADALRLKGSPRDSLLKIMMQESDNFIAEQLMLQSAWKTTNVMSDSAFFDLVRHTYLQEVEDDIQWADASGLSRYNLITPRALVTVLRKIYDHKGQAYIRHIFAAGGQSGTIRDWFGEDASTPYVYAKSGGMKNTYCLSGYLLTRSGNILIFSWMNNQFTEAPSAVKASMAKMFSFLYEEY